MSRSLTLVERLVELSVRAPDLPAFHEQREATGWQTLTWGEVQADVRAIAGGLVSLGLERGDTVALIGDNRADLVALQLGVQFAGGVPVPVYSTLTAEQAGFVVTHSGARFVAADSSERLDRVAGSAEAAGACLSVRIAYAEAATEATNGALRLDDLRAMGRSRCDEVDARLAAHDGTDLALLIYTSGTTGQPKGVEIPHAAIGVILDEVLGLVGETLAGDRYRVVSYLPLAHIAEQMMSAVVPIAFAGEVFFCPRLELLREVLLVARPSIFLAVPRVWEKIQVGLEQRFEAAGWAQRALVSWALATELSAFDREVTTGSPVLTLPRRIAERLVLGRIRKALGLDRLRVAISGAAPIGLETLRFFAGLGIPITEVFGMTETVALISANRPARPRLGTCGPALGCGQMRIDADGEILYRGTNLARGYRGDPAATAELFDGEGWLHTGDLGQIDGDRCLRVIGRKKELLVTAGGKKVAPAEVEPLLLALPGVSQAVLVGDGRPYLCALLTLDPASAATVAAGLGIAAENPTALAHDPRFRAHLKGEVDSRVNVHLSRYQTVKRIDILDRELSVADGELTPTLKLRRAVIADLYAGRIAALYEE